MNLKNKNIKWNKTLEFVFVSVGLRSLLPHKSKFALKKLLALYFDHFH